MEIAGTGSEIITTVSELIEVLKRCPQAAKIIMASDEEGNAYGTINRTLEVVKIKQGFGVVMYPYKHVSSCLF